MSSILLGFLWRRHRLSTGLALLIPILIGLAIGLLYPTYAAQRKLLEVFKFSTAYFGQGQLDLFSAEGSFTLPFQHPLCLLNHALIGGIAALGLPAGERGRGALDMLLSTPLERGRLIRTLSFFALLSAATLGAVGSASAYLGAWLSDEVAALDHVRYAVVALDSVGLVFALSGLAMVVSVMARDRAQATMWYGVGTAVFFLADVLARMWSKGDWISFLTPFGYLRPARVVGLEDGLHAGLRDAAVLFGFAIFLHVVAAWQQSRRRSA